jgi:argininosuccinate lyase
MSISMPSSAPISTLMDVDNQSSLHQKSQAWSALFDQPMSELLKEYTASVRFDQKLAVFDIQGSCAHAQMLAEQKIITEADATLILNGLSDILAQIQAGKFSWSVDLEDVHLNIEARLTEKIGIAGKRLHTGRSRNDQVATDIRLWLRHETDGILNLIRSLQQVFLDVAGQHVDTIMPGFTHLQVAQPISFAHHLLAYVEMFERDFQRLNDVRKRINQLPLGAGALAGTSYPINRLRVAELLDFEGVCENSLDAVSDRDFAIEFSAFAAIFMMHISRLCEEFIIWSNPRFAFIQFSDGFCTGSSIMPQKKNPDVAELARGKSARVYGHLIALLTLMKSQPLAYNKDNQEDKEPLFDVVQTLNQTLRVLIDMVAQMHIRPENMRLALNQGHASATDLADYLVKKGMAFRDAHEIVAHAVKLATYQQKDLSELSWQAIREMMPENIKYLIAEDAENAISLEGVLAARNHLGGTAPAQIRLQLAKWQMIFEQYHQAL